MSTLNTSDRIVRELRSADKPALSAADLADELDVTVKTINNNIEPLVERGDVETTQIGNATAYYISSSDVPAHKKPEHTCKRCGREAPTIYDMAKLDLEQYFDGVSQESGNPTFYVLCRFCYADLVRWLYGDDGAMGVYEDVHTWDIPGEQLHQVRADDETVSAPGEPYEGMEEHIHTAYEIFDEIAGDRDSMVQKPVLMKRLRDKLSVKEAKEAYDWLESCGHFRRDGLSDRLLPAR